MKAEYGKYYLLNVDKYYFCPALSREVKFIGKLAVKCDSSFEISGHFGKLVDTSNPNGPDYETNQDIEFSDNDIISEYQLKDIPLMYYEFKWINKKDLIL